jgi:hypothetical protein
VRAPLASLEAVCDRESRRATIVKREHKVRARGWHAAMQENRNATGESNCVEVGAELGPRVFVRQRARPLETGSGGIVGDLVIEERE